MHSNAKQNIDNRRAAERKPAGTGTASSETRFTPKHPHSHHGLLKGPYYPLVSHLPAGRTAT
ncbi:MAG: hypothetical protein P4N60_02760 [Verrucomicrobiae bacterium]|nr:hypothetical protein [Verrucomicrobiae bacterium]